MVVHQTLPDLKYSRKDVDGDDAAFNDSPSFVKGHYEEEEGHKSDDMTELPTQRRSALEYIHDAKRRPERPYVTICAPMVRYSKLPFRELVRGYGVDIAYTPMILADVYKHSQISRDHEYRTNKADDPVVIQFASSTPGDLADAAELVAPYANGVDLNCGCPQKWAVQEKIGSYLMEQPELVREMVRQVKARTNGCEAGNGSTTGGGLPCSIKIRVHRDPRKTVEFVRRAESVGVDWVTVHGRTRHQKSSEPVSLDAIKLVKEHASPSMPVLANGDVFSLTDADRIVDYTGVDGVMAARGLLENPALFAGYEHTPIEAVQKFVRLSTGYGSAHFILHHHLMYMLDSSMSKAEKKTFNVLTSTPGVIDYLSEHYGLEFPRKL